MKKTESQAIKVYYNSACPVCRSGIEGQKGKAAQCEIEWGDVHENNELVDNIGKTLSTTRKYLHATDQNGELKIGIEAFIVILETNKQDKWKANILRLPLIKPLAKIVYYVFANLLFAWNKALKHW